MIYNIKTYQEGYIEKQFEIGSKIYDPWPMGGQTRPDQLKASYSSDNFDPETRFYAFNENKMVGFLTSSYNETKEGRNYYFFEFPYVLKDHQPQAERQLIEHAIAALKEKGADVLVSRAGDYWGKSLFYALEYGFEKTTDIARRGEIRLNKVSPDDFGNYNNLVDYNPAIHLDKFAELYAEKFSSSVEQMKQQLIRWNKLQPGDSFKSPWDHTLTLLSHKAIMKKDKVIGRVVIMDHSNFPTNTINLSQLLLDNPNKQIIGDVLSELVRAGKEHNKDIAVIHTGAWGSFPTDEPFKPYNIPFEMKLAHFEKVL